MLEDDGFYDIATTDSSFKNLPAKLITATGLSYNGKRKIYLVKSGDYVYQFTFAAPDVNKRTELFNAVLKGSTITEKKFGF